MISNYESSIVNGQPSHSVQEYLAPKFSNLRITDNSSKVQEMRKPVPQVFSQMASPTDHSSRVPAVSEWLPIFFGKSESPISQSFSLKKRPSNVLAVNSTKYVKPYVLSKILNWNTEWLTEYSESETPNQLSSLTTGTGIKTSYVSLEEYKSAYIPLIWMETRAQIYSDYNDENSSEFQVMRAPDNKQKNRSQEEDSDIFNTLFLNTVVAENKIKDYPSEGDLIVLDLNKDYDPSNKKVFAYVLGFYFMAILPKTKLQSGLSVPKNCLNPCLLTYVVAVSKSIKMIDIKENALMYAKAAHNLRQIIRQIWLLSKLDTSPLLKDILKPRLSACKLEVPTNISLSCDKFNEPQKRAILGITQAVKSEYSVPKLVFIQGPPGTGKTFTLIETLKHIYMNWDSEESLPRILICAPSNGAVNEISRRIYKERDFLAKHRLERHRRGLRCVRVGNESKIEGDARIIWLDKLVRDILGEFWRRKREKENRIKELKTRIKILDKEMAYLSPPKNTKTMANTQKKRNNLMNECLEVIVQNSQLKIESYSKIEMKIMENADIVLSTLNSTNSSPIADLFKSHGSQTFDCVIIDEASQCSEPEVLMPLVYQMSKMILIGDPKQLPATVISKKASSLNLGRSLFERFYNYFLQCEQNNPNQKSPVLMLTEQYRMHPQICRFPSKQFYGRKLTTNSEVMKSRDFNLLKPYIVFDMTDTIEKSDPTKKSKLNLKEANFVIRLATLIDQMVKRCAANQKRYAVGVITPYKGQKNHLIEVLKYKCFKNIVIDVNTVDGFQGQERDIIIFSGVRAFHTKDKRKSIGFINSMQRMNVALTRAKYSMILCISGHTLQRDKNWKCLIDDSIRRRNIRFKVTSKLSVKEVKKILAPIESQNI